MPVWFIGKRREALTGNSEVYKRQIVGYLEKRGYYLKADSYVEATFADCILTKKEEPREYWLEAKATKISLGESSFLLQLGKYLAEYLRRTSANRFKLILACYNIKDPHVFEQVFGKLELGTIKKTLGNIVEAGEANTKATISNADLEDVRRFFEDTVVIVANPSELEVAEEKIAPSPPTAPSLSDAEYASEILKKFGDIEPLQASDVMHPNLFKLNLPDELYMAETSYRTAKAMFNEKPNVIFHAFRLESGKLYSFSEISQDTLLGKFADLESVRRVDLEEFDKDENNRRIVIRILNTWIRSKCKRHGLWFDRRTQSYFFPKRGTDDNPITVVWTPKSRRSKREITKPMMMDDKIIQWVHRAAEIFARKFWGDYYLQIRPRWLFSSDGRRLFEGERADRLDRAFRKSIYNRNLNQLYDVLFWYRYIFSETDVLGDLRLDAFSRTSRKRWIKVGRQIEVESGYKPNVEVEEEVEKFDEILPSFLEKSLDEFM